MYVSNCNVSMLKFSHCCWENSVESCKAAANKELFTSVPSVGRNDPIALHTRPLDVELKINDPLISGASAVHAFVRLTTIRPAVITADFDPIYGPEAASLGFVNRVYTNLSRKQEQ